MFVLILLLIMPWQMAPVASETIFDVYCAARDEQGNFDEPPAELIVTTLDITPPEFIGGTPRVRSVRETAFAIVVQLGEQGEVCPDRRTVVRM